MFKQGDPFSHRTGINGGPDNIREFKIQRHSHLQQEYCLKSEFECVLSVLHNYILYFYPLTLNCQFRQNPPKVEFQWTIIYKFRKRNKI